MSVRLAGMAISNLPISCQYPDRRRERPYPARRFPASRGLDDGSATRASAGGIGIQTGIGISKLTFSQAPLHGQARSRRDGRASNVATVTGPVAAYLDGPIHPGSKQLPPARDAARLTPTPASMPAGLASCETASRTCISRSRRSSARSRPGCRRSTTTTRSGRSSSSQWRGVRFVERVLLGSWRSSAPRPIRSGPWSTDRYPPPPYRCVLSPLGGLTLVGGASIAPPDELEA